MSPMARLVSLCVVTVLIVFLGITFFQVIAPFLMPLFLAGVVTILCQPMFRYFLVRTKNRVRIAAGLTTAAVLSMFLVPLLVGMFIGTVQLYALTQRNIESGAFGAALDSVRRQLDSVTDNVKDDVFDLVQEHLPQNPDISDQHAQTAWQKAEFEKQAAELREDSRQQLQSLAKRSLGFASKTLDTTFNVLGSAVSALVGLLMFCIALYYFLADGPALLSATQALIPVYVGYQKELLQQFDKVVRAVVLATFMAAIGQGLATSVALYIVGFHHFFIIFIVATFASLIPVAGTWLIWGPCAILLGSQGHWGSVAFLVIFGVAVIGTMDNVIRAFVLQSDAKLHPLLAFVSVLGGLQMMGLWGVFIGPIIACCLHALIQIFNTELTEFSKERFAHFPMAGSVAVPKPKFDLEAAAGESGDQNAPNGKSEPPVESPRPSASAEESPDDGEPAGNSEATDSPAKHPHPSRDAQSTKPAEES